MSDSRIGILIEQTKRGTGAKDTVSDLKGLDQAAKQLSGGLSGIASAAGTAGILALGTAAAGTVFELGKVAATAGDMRVVFDSMARDAGESGDAMLSAMQKTSAGMVSDAALVGAANRAMLLGVADSSAEMSQLLEVARVRGQAMGLSLEEAFERVVNGIGRQSALILDDLGIQLDATAVNEAYAASLGRTAESLSETEKKQALFNHVLAQTQPLIASSVGAGQDQMASFEQLATSATNAKMALGELALVSGLPSMLQGASDEIEGITDKIRDLVISIGLLKAGEFEELFAFETGDLEGFAKDKMEGIGEQLASKAAELREAQSAFNQAAISGDPESEIEKVAELEYAIASLGEEYNKRASQAGEPLLDLNQLQQGIVITEGAANAIDSASEAVRSAQAEQAGWNSLLSEAPGVVRQWAIELMGAGASLDEVKSKVEGSKDAFKEIQDAQDSALSGLFQAGGEQVDVLGLDKVLESIGPASEKIKVAVANIFQDFANGSIGADELAIRLSALGDEADTLAGQITTAGQETEQFTAAVMQSPAVLAGLQAAAAAAGIPLDELIARLGDTKAALLDLIGTAGGASSRIFSSVASVADIVGDEAAIAAGEAALKNYNREAARLAEQHASGAISAERYEFGMARLNDSTDDYAEGVRKAEQDSRSLAKTLEGEATKAAREAEKAFDDLKSKVSSVLSDALGDTAGVNPDEILDGLGLHEDAIAENARRLADVAMNGFKDQDWMGEFASEVPDIFKALQESGDPKAAAAQMLKEFQAGFRPELLDKDLLKDAVRDMIASDKAKEDLATEIATELAAEMGASMPGALAAAREALGAAGGEGGTIAMPGVDAESTAAAGEAAGTTFGAGIVSGMVDAGAQAIARFSDVLKNEENMKLIGAAGAANGKRWADDFFAAVSENGLPQALADYLVNALAPGVAAKQRQQQSLQGASG